jgi:hypothetical protein
MKDIEFSFGDALVPQNSVIETAEKLKPEIGNMANAISKGARVRLYVDGHNSFLQKFLGQQSHLTTVVPASL